MVSKRWRFTSGRIVGAATLLAVPMLVDCGGKGMPGVPGVPGASCPADVSDPMAVYNANFGFEGKVESQVKGALAAGANLQRLAAEIEGEVAMACGELAKDLGATDIDPKEEGPGKRAEAACQAAVKAITEMKAKAKGELKVEVTPPKCYASMDAMAECAGQCSADVKPGEAKVECEGGDISGKCEAECKGQCTVEAGAKCEGSCGGTCNGACEGEISGQCDGKCTGQCDGKDVKGAKCTGVCNGKCAGQAKADCKGTCKGSCDANCTMEAKGSCSGMCSGSCSVEFKEPKCSGEVKPPEMSAECKANCDAQVSGKVECVPAQVTANIAGGADAEAGAKLKAALEKHLPALLKVSVGMKGRLEGVGDNVKAAIEGGKAVIEAGGTSALKVAGCFASSAQASAEASVQINVSVQASASASAEAGAG